MPEYLNSSYGIKLTVSQAVEEIIRFMEDQPERQYKITIGTDSQATQSGNPDFVTAVVVHRVGNGGRFFWRRIKLSKFHTLRDRIIREVIISLDIAKDILAKLKENTSSQFDFEIHADIGENGPTKAMLQEVVGMIRAHNFEPKTKPESYAATSVADRLV
jgi:predicted RNase H-related nuclease YkuK (DUF458 family)